MKTLIKITLVLVIPLMYFAVFSGFKSGGNETGNKTVLAQIPPSPAPKDFTNCIFNFHPDIASSYWITGNILNYSDELHFNTVHTYDRIERTTNGTPAYGMFDQDLTGTQKDYIDIVTNDVSNAGLDFWYERVKISKLCYAQRLVYEIKDPREGLVNNGFCYQTTYGDYTTDDGRTVLHLNPNTNTENYIASGIYENLQHGDLYVFNIQYADEGVWNVKPMMRIPTGIQGDKEVVRIEVINYNNQVVKTMIIKAENFGPNYDGSYKDVFTDVNNEITGGNGEVHDPPQLNDGQSQLNWRQWATACHTDFKVKWMGEVEVWFDKMTVDDKWANELFDTDPQINHDEKIEDELDYYFTQPYRTYTFFADEITYSQFEAIKYVKNKINDYCTQYSYEPPNLNIASSNYHNIRGYKDNTIEHRIMYQELQPYSVNIDAHEIVGVKIPNTLPASGFSGNNWIASSYNDYTQSLQLKGFGDRNSITPETSEISNYDPSWQGSLVYQIVKAREQRNQYSQNTKFIMQPQIHGILRSSNGGVNWVGGMREPTNEEIQAEAMLSIAHGAEGICWYLYQSFYDNASSSSYSMRAPFIGDMPDPADVDYTFGLMDWSVQPRNNNLYGQEKWNDVAAMNQKIEDWKPTLDNLYWLSAYSTHSEGTAHGCITDIESIYRNSTYPYEFNPANLDQTKYWEMGFFEPLEPHFDEHIKYVMFVNRRCVPETNPGIGDIRQLKIKFNSASFLNYNNWTICDVLYPDDKLVFNKNSNNYIDLGSMSIFQPGEGRIFRLEPVFQTGGTLVTDEYVIADDPFTCEDTVWTDGYNLTIENGVNITFSDSAKFVVEGGTFQLGTPDYQGPLSTEMDGSWKGFEFVEANVKIYNTNFSGLANDSISMLTMIDCPLVDLRNNTFSLGTGSNKGAIDIAYSGSYQPGVTDNVYIGSNTFDNSSTILPYVKIMAYSGITIPVIIEENGFTGSSTALFLSNIQGGAIKSNTFTGFDRSITALSSTLDIYDNTISSTTGIYGLEALSGTELKMSYAGGLLVGGRNNITNSDSSSYNIYLEDSYFLMDEGENIFDVGYNGWHLYGWFPESYSGSYYETENCFKVNSTVVDPPVEYATLGEQGYQITDFVFTPYLTGCTQGGEGDMMVINLGNDIYDTIGIMGEGGSYSSNYVVTPNTIYDSISISMRYRNYANVKSLCLYLLNTYPDSVQSLGALSKLYLAVSKTDTTTQGITDLKTLYENLILNHSNNISLVKRCNYYVQKCKVLLHQYSSALTGFQQIINNNPASYEGLVARWDYMATSLLMQGQGGAERNWDFRFGISELSNDEFDDDKSPFTKEERKQIKQTVTTALEISKYTEKKREKVLIELSTRGDENASRQLKVLKSLEQTVRTEKPKNIAEHLKIVSGDIQKVFVNPNKGKNTNTTFIPQKYRLSQNYPNPFNPTTKISYDIPKNSIVKIIIYDILGREVMKLVNNEFKQPGRYVVEFNGINLASGVYFYRIEAGNFVEAKKMVLVK